MPASCPARRSPPCLLPSPMYGLAWPRSFHGVAGECGLRGGYFELQNIPADVRAQITKLASISLCSNVIGQFATGLMVRPPRSGEPSYEEYVSERHAILHSLAKRAQATAAALSALPGISCNEPEGAMCNAAGASNGARAAGLTRPSGASGRWSRMVWGWWGRTPHLLAKHRFLTSSYARWACGRPLPAVAPTDTRHRSSREGGRRGRRILLLTVRTIGSNFVQQPPLAHSRAPTVLTTSPLVRQTPRGHRTRGRTGQWVRSGRWHVALPHHVPATRGPA